MTEYPVKVKWPNQSAAHAKFVTRELEPLYGTPEDQRELSDDELDTISEAVVAREKTNIVVENQIELELVVSALRNFVEGIGHPAYGGKWATDQMASAVQRRVDALQDARNNDCTKENV